MNSHLLEFLLSAPIVLSVNPVYADDYEPRLRPGETFVLITKDNASGIGIKSTDEKARSVTARISSGGRNTAKQGTIFTFRVSPNAQFFDVKGGSSGKPKHITLPFSLIDEHHDQTGGSLIMVGTSHEGRFTASRGYFSYFGPLKSLDQVQADREATASRAAAREEEEKRAAIENAAGWSVIDGALKNEILATKDSILMSDALVKDAEFVYETVLQVGQGDLVGLALHGDRTGKQCVVAAVHPGASAVRVFALPYSGDTAAKQLAMPVGKPIRLGVHSRRAGRSAHLTVFVDGKEVLQCEQPLSPGAGGHLGVMIHNARCSYDFLEARKGTGNSAGERLFRQDFEAPAALVDGRIAPSRVN